MWNQTEINRLLASIAHTIPPMTEEGFEKVEEWYNRGLPTTKQWTARQLFKKYEQLVYLVISLNFVDWVKYAKSVRIKTRSRIESNLVGYES